MKERKSKFIGKDNCSIKGRTNFTFTFSYYSTKTSRDDLEESIGNYEFSVMPKSMFTDDGQLLLSTDKAKILHEIESLVKEESSVDVDVEYMDQYTKRGTVIDGMALVN